MEQRRLGPYLLERRIGAGGFGAVWIGVHEQSGARHALKVLELATPEEAQRFQREAEALVRMDGHPHSVRVHAAFSVGSTAVLVTELVEGPGDLAAHLKSNGPLPPGDALRLVVCVARAVAHAHARGVLHRDLKPANVLIDQAGAPRLIDLGLAAVSGERSLTRTGEIMGTPGYVAPEQVQGSRGDARTDVFGLGALLFACLTGRPPREGGQAMALLMRAATQPLPPVESLRADVPPSVCALVRRATELDPARRHASVVDLIAALERELGGAARSRSRVGAVVTGLGLGAALLFAVLASSGGRTRESPAPISSGFHPAWRELRALSACSGEPARLILAARDLHHALDSAPVPSELATEVLDAQSRLVSWTLAQTEAEPGRLDEEVSGAVSALTSLAGLAGVDSAMLFQRRSARIDELAARCGSELDRAIQQDLRSTSRDERIPAPATRDWVRRIRAALRPGQADVPGEALVHELERALNDLVARARDPQGESWESSTRVLLALETYRSYWLDARRSAVFTGHADTANNVPKHVRGLHQLNLARLGYSGSNPEQLGRVEPELYELCPRSRLLTMGHLERRSQAKPGEIEPLPELVRLVLAVLHPPPDDLDRLIGGTSAVEGIDASLCGHALECAYRLARNLAAGGRAPEGRQLIGRVLPAIEGCVSRLPADLHESLVQGECNLRRELARNLGASSAIPLDLRRRRVELGLGTVTKQARGRIELVQDLRLAARLSPASRTEHLEEAERVARAAAEMAWRRDERGFSRHAQVVLGQVLLDRGARLEEVEKIVAGLREFSTEQGVLDGTSQGEFSLLSLRLALARHDEEGARDWLASARQLAELHPEWSTTLDLLELARELPPR